MNNFTKRNVIITINIKLFDFFSGQFKNLTLFWDKKSWKIQMTLEKKVDILEKNVVWDFSLELDIESIKNNNFEIPDPW